MVQCLMKTVTFCINEFEKELLSIIAYFIKKNVLQAGPSVNLNVGTWKLCLYSITI